MPALPPVELARENVVLDGYEELRAKPLEEKLAAVVEMEKQTAGQASQIHTAASTYREMFEEKIVVTSDGASASQKLVRPELRLAAFASESGEHNVAGHSLGVTGGWNCLFDHHRAEGIVEKTARQAVELDVVSAAESH